MVSINVSKYGEFMHLMPRFPDYARFTIEERLNMFLKMMRDVCDGRAAVVATGTAGEAWEIRLSQEFREIDLRRNDTPDEDALEVGTNTEMASLEADLKTDEDDADESFPGFDAELDYGATDPDDLPPAASYDADDAMFLEGPSPDRVAISLIFNSDDRAAEWLATLVLGARVVPP